MMRHPCTLVHNARYTKLCGNWRKRNRHCFYGRIRKVIPLPTSSCISRKIIRNVANAQQPIEISSVKHSCVRRNQSTVISQNHIFKIIGNICGVANVVSCLAIFRQRNLSSAEAKLGYFTISCASRHKTLIQSLSNCPVVIDISIITKPNRLLARYRLLVDAAYMHVGNFTQFNFQAIALQ